MVVMLSAIAVRLLPWELFVLWLLCCPPLLLMVAMGVVFVVVAMLSATAV